MKSLHSFGLQAFSERWAGPDIAAAHGMARSLFPEGFELFGEFVDRNS